MSFCSMFGRVFWKDVLLCLEMYLVFWKDILLFVWKISWIEDQMCLEGYLVFGRTFLKDIFKDIFEGQYCNGILLTVWKGSCMSWGEFCPPCCDACPNPAENNNCENDDDNNDD